MWKWEAEGQAKAVVVIFHSAYEHHAWYAWLIEKFRKSGFHVVTGDLPGHGEASRLNRYHDEDFYLYYEFGKKLIDIAFTEGLPVFVIGNGLGAAIAIRAIFKGKYECAGLILSSPWFQLKLQPGKLSGALSSIGALTSHMKLTHNLSLTTLTRNIEGQGEMKDNVPFNTIVTVHWYKELQSLFKFLKDREVVLPQLPILLMTGGRDSLIDRNAAKQWMIQQGFSHFQYCEWKDCLHSLYFEMEREDIFQYTLDFIHNSLRSYGYIISK